VSSQLDSAQKADEQMRRLGFPETENGPYATELRAKLESMYSRGMTYMSGGTWDADYEVKSWEDHARRWLAFMWATENRSHKVECLDKFPITRYTAMDIVDGKPVLRHKYKIYPKQLLPWMRDQYRRTVFKLKKRTPNPYKES
jgi:hypothetical protein